MKGIFRVLLIAVLLCVVLLSSAAAEEMIIFPEEDMSYLEKVVVEKNAQTVSIMLPPEMVTEEGVWEGSIPPAYNADGGMTLTLTYSEFDEYLNTLRETLNEGLQDMVADESFGFVSIEAGESFTEYTITINGEELSFAGIFGVYGLQMYSIIYSVYSGESIDMITFSIVDGNTGTVVSSFTDADLAEATFE